ncbi:DnaJ domain [Arabidopsis suecica]|uniref:DnaJ domain n=1 Tax=Arabidopsis suecica TaxID=45249 RepID=A0A8T1YQ82_ARASU|nr:DnaJ domain [Arabidopsis suecica]
MEAYREEAFKATQIAERRFAEKDFAGARSYALRAKSLFADLEGLSQMLTTYEVYKASQSRRSGKIDYYAVLGLKPSAGKREVKKQYKNMVVLLHPDKNKCLELTGHFRSYLKLGFSCQDSIVVHQTERLDTFWIVCTSCKVQYEYQRKYVNKRLSSKNCRGAFIAVEDWAGSCQYPAHGYEYITNKSYDWSSYVGTSLGNLESNPISSVSNGYPNKLTSGVALIKASRPENKRNVGLGLSGNGFVENITKYNLESKATNLDTKMEHEFKHPGQSYGSMRWWSSAIGLDTRKLLINKVKTDIMQRLEIMRLASEDAVAASEAVAIEDATPLDDVSASSKVGDDVSRMGKNVSSGHPPVRKINGPITVRDSDFHDFDTNRSEECFEGRQIWAIYDEDDGMPRLYCMVREVLFVQPFKIDIAYLSSKTDIKFGTMKWV